MVDKQGNIIWRTPAQERPLSNSASLRPTAEQYELFASYLCEAHSWYKLPLMTGNQFVVFVAAAGNRKQFGYLDYMWRANLTETYRGDLGQQIQLPPELDKRCSFVLYPYVSWRLIQDIGWPGNTAAIEALRNGAAHPAREELLEMARLSDERTLVSNAFSDSDLELTVLREQPSETAPPRVKKFLELSNKIQDVYRVLMAQEAAKIRRALSELDNWLLSQ